MSSAGRRPIPAARNNHGEVMGVLRSAADAAAPDLQILFVDSAAVVGMECRTPI